MKHQKIAPGLLNAILDMEERGTHALTVRVRSLGVAHAVGSQKEPSVPVFLRCKEKANFEELAKHKVRVNESSGSVRTAYLPVSAVGRLSEHKDVQRISPSRPMRPSLNVALPAVHIPQFRTKTNTSGAGVIVGIVDSGIDPNHPSFAGRILRIWDQTISGPGVAEGNFGLELTGPAITASRDTNGHGTHVAGIAAGADSTFGGIAPVKRRLDVWATDFEAGSSAQFLDAATNEMKIGSPGCSLRAVTVAAFTTRNQWKDRAGTPSVLASPLTRWPRLAAPARCGVKKGNRTSPHPGQ